MNAVLIIITVVQLLVALALMLIVLAIITYCPSVPLMLVH